MFATAELINPQRHRGLRFNPVGNLLFAKGQLALPLASSELMTAARDMLIVFPLDHGAPLALAGYEEGRNLYVTADGQWQGRYVPAVLRAYPFRLVALDHKDNGETQHFAVQIDPEAPHFAKPEGQSLIDDTGGPSPLLLNAQKALLALQADFQRARSQVKALDDQGLLTTKHVIIARGSAGERAMTGFRMVDEEQVNNLPPDTLAALRDSGALRMLFAHLLSMSNLRDGLLAMTAMQAGSGVGELPGWLTEEEDTMDFSNILRDFTDGTEQ